MKIRHQLQAALLLSLFLLSLAGCGNKTGNSQKEVSQALGISMKDGTELSYSDTHGGFHGDGTKFIALRISDPTFLDSINQNDEWKSLPLNTTLSSLLYGTTQEQGQIGPYVTDSGGSALFPPIENGCYYFQDRFSDHAGSLNSSDVLSRSSFNFTIAIYDTDSDILYYCEFDT